MVHRDEIIASEACSAVRTLLATDAAGDGNLARDAVQLVADLVKRRKCVAPPETVEVLLGLTLRSAKASDVKSGGEYRLINHERSCHELPHRISANVASLWDSASNLDSCLAFLHDAKSSAACTQQSERSCFGRK